MAATNLEKKYGKSLEEKHCKDTLGEREAQSNEVGEREAPSNKVGEREAQRNKIGEREETQGSLI